MSDVVKQFNKKQQIWFKQKDGQTEIGFTSKFLDTIHDCWHVTLANKTTIKANSPLFTIETNDALFAVTSPVDGSIISFSDRAQNFPDKLTEDDVVCTISEKPAKATKTVVTPQPTVRQWEDIINEAAALNDLAIAETAASAFRVVEEGTVIGSFVAPRTGPLRGVNPDLQRTQQRINRLLGNADGTA